jgi:uncharacterized membrane protein YciS (DUF1049 family)
MGDNGQKADGSPPQGAGPSPTSGQPGTQQVMLVLGVPGLLAIAVYAIDRSSWSVAALAVIVGAASFAVGALLGFLFGVPVYTARQASADPSRPTYQPNTNLTQVSDWLTKIIIGVSLVQFGQLTSALGDLGDSLGPSLGGSSAGRPFAIALVVGYFVVGLLCGYLYTRLRLQWAFTQADRAFEQLIEQKLQARDSADEAAIGLAGEQLDPVKPNPSFDDLKAALAPASPSTREQIRRTADSSQDGAGRDIVIKALGETESTS